MPNYFADYDTTAFYQRGGAAARPQRIPHGGFVIRRHTGWDSEHSHVIEVSLKADSTRSSPPRRRYARAVYRMAAEGQKGCKTVFDGPRPI